MPANFSIPQIEGVFWAPVFYTLEINHELDLIQNPVYEANLIGPKSTWKDLQDPMSILFTQLIPEILSDSELIIQFQSILSMHAVC